MKFYLIYILVIIETMEIVKNASFFSVSNFASNCFDKRIPDIEVAA